MDNKIKILAVGKSFKGKLWAWIEQGDYYKKIVIDKKDVVKVHASEPVSKYGLNNQEMTLSSYDHFAAMVGKFNPYTDFFIKPVECDLTYKDCLRVYKSGGRGRWKST